MSISLDLFLIKTFIFGLSWLVFGADRVIADEFIGVVHAEEEVELSSEVSGIVTTVNVHLGDRVVAGDILAELDCTVLKIEAERAENAVAMANSKLAISRRLLELKSVGKEQILIEELEAKRAELDLQLAQNTVSKCIIRAPIDGLVNTLLMKEYALIEARNPVISVVNLRKGWVAFVAPISLGLQVDDTITVITQFNQSYPAVIKQAAPTIEPVSQTREFRAWLDPLPDGILPGTTLSVVVN